VTPEPGGLEVELRWATELDSGHVDELTVLFDTEYAGEWGPWNPRTGYGYAAVELHALSRLDGRLVGHAGSGRRFVGVGDGEVVVAGIGGVLTAPDVRGRGVGRALLGALQDAARGSAPADFGLLGCREDVVPFYESCGFRRTEQLVRDLSPRDGSTVVEGRGPTLVCAGTRQLADWPDGTIDLRGLPW
jgi:aminoglycoside 2'-N-acetyltransferase I